MVESVPPVIHNSSSTCKHFTAPECPRNRPASEPVDKSQTRTVSSNADDTRVPYGSEKSKALIAFESGLPILIDNGSFELRAGFASPSGESNPAVSMESVISKYKDRKNPENFLLAGSACFTDAQSRSAMKSPFDGDVVTNFEVMENILDYTFLQLGVQSETVDHPLLMTETLCNPTYSRALMNELLFENYQVRSVCYGLDSLFSAFQNDIHDGLAISSGRNSTTLVPILDGKGMIDFSKRMNWGGQQAADYLLRLVQLKFSAFPTRVTPSQAIWMRDNLTRMFDADEESYEEFVGRLSRPEALAKEDRVVQFPYTAEVKEEKTQEELDQIAERKREAGRRLQEQTKRIRLEKLMQKENDLKYYEDLKEWKNKEKKAEYLKRLEQEGFSGENELESTMKKLQDALKKARSKELGEEEGETKEVPTFPLADTPDDQLDEEGIKEKRKQRFLRAGYEARIRAKAEKDEEKRILEAKLKKEDDERINDPRGWAAKKRREYEDTIQRIKDRKRRKEMLNDRKSLAAQQRMKNITSLASDAPAGSSSRRRKRGNEEDTFGADDEDWNLYREIKPDEDSDVSEEENAALDALEERLLKHDSTFTQEDTYDARLKRKNRLTLTFLRGMHPEWDIEDVAQQNQIHLNLERTRVPEVLYKPYLAGVDQAGLDEVTSLILSNFDLEKRKRMANNIFVTGQHTLYSGFDQRLYNSVRATQPIDIPVRVVRAKDVRFDAWRGMRKWTLENNEEFLSSSIKRQEYEEKGSEWFKEHRFSATMTI
ncbi:actin-like ATPase domain-containing protein [Meira miltonrushii]|uniref:Actin-like ATPase domain-containing protein n=1 Tax=Meira miltonrushii TaxID=1280837 RepID=A0A316VJV2_9BASI|nr:actin-like ATPase domain-containing protein [Meira miltonrushii]PWN37790.1 actin-like ATPase domain-containing protein [Meira miltonrushii]